MKDVAPMPRHGFADSMKALGMILIVYGHVAHGSTVPLTPPVYLKQFGVALFLFVTGFMLARERRPAPEAVARRLVPLYGCALAVALLLSAWGAVTRSGLALSNYLPLAAGINVVVDSFPANPTTWFVGTYVHIVVLWALWLRRVRIRPWTIVAAGVLEIPVRALAMTYAGPYVAYMLFTNWMAVFLLGMYNGQRDRGDAGYAPLPAVGLTCALIAGLAVSAFVFHAAGVTPTFPFMTAAGDPGPFPGAAVSAGVSLLYVSVTGLVFGIARRVPSTAVARFIARNTPLIFVAHMPVYFASTPWLVHRGLGYWPRAATEFAVCLIGLGLLSELLRAAARTDLVHVPVTAARTALYRALPAGASLSFNRIRPS